MSTNREQQLAQERGLLAANQRVIHDPATPPDEQEAARRRAVTAHTRIDRLRR